MSSQTASRPGRLHHELRQELLRLARQEEDIAAAEAEGVRYWETMPVDVAVHRRCAAALRAAADELLPPADL